MGIPVEIVGEGIDWPAWVQAVGSIVAIFASAALAIGIDQGAARRAAKAAKVEAAREEAERQRRQLDWLKSMSSGVQALNNLSALARQPADDIDGTEIARVARNMSGTMQMYLMQGPPDPFLGWARFAVHGEFGPVIMAAEGFQRNDHYSLHLLRETLAGAATRSAQIRVEYLAGIE